MTMEWNNRNNGFDSNGENGKGSFEQHNERMTEFRSSHANVTMVNAPRLDEAGLLENLRPLRICRSMMGTGGSAFPNGTMDQLALIPMWRVARYKLSQN